MLEPVVPVDRQEALLRTLLRITDQINAGLLLEHVLDSIFDSFRPLIPYDRIGLALLDDGGRTVRNAWSRNDSEGMRLALGFQMPLDRTSLGALLDSSTPRVLNDLEDYLARHPQSAATRLIVDEGMRSSLTCPLRALGREIGFLFFSSRQPDCYRDAHVEIFQEIAGHVSLAVEKSRLYQELVQLNDEKNRFLGMAAHDLRNPIGVAQGYLRLVLAESMGPVPPAQRRLLEKVERSCEKMLSLVNDLLDLSVIESGKVHLDLEEVALSPYLADLAETNGLLARAKGITLVANLPEELPTLVLDRRRFGQVLDNLLSNAVKFSNPGTTVTLGAEATDRRVRIFVRDQGPGIPHEEVRRLFSGFARGSNRPTGGETSTGLGLAITRRIVEAHYGKIGVLSRLGEGSTFTVTLPRTDKA